VKDSHFDAFVNHHSKDIHEVSIRFSQSRW